jgi:hypothetical protein
MFTTEQRDRVSQSLIERAERDERVTSAAIVGAEAGERADRWSDVDLTLGVSDEASVDEVMTDWTSAIDTEFDGPHLFDVHAGPSIYRVFLLPGNLQVDLSFTPAARFGPTSPDFRLIFGKVMENRVREPMSRLAETPRQRFGLCVLYLIRTRFSLERENLGRAEHYFRLAAELLGDRTPSLPAPPTHAALLAAQQEALETLIRDPGAGRDLAQRLESQLRELAAPTLGPQ